MTVQIWIQGVQVCALYLSHLRHWDTPVFVPLLCPPINSSWPLSPFTPRASVFVIALIFSAFPFLPRVPPRVVLLLNVKWGHGHTWMCCDKLAQRRQMVTGRRLVVMPFAASDMNWSAHRARSHTCSARVIPTLVTPHAQTRTPANSDTHATLHQPSIPISINDVCSGGACWLSEALCLAPLGEARGCCGIWQRDRAQTNGRLVGLWELRHTAYCTDAYRHRRTVHVSRPHM